MRNSSTKPLAEVRGWSGAFQASLSVTAAVLCALYLRVPVRPRKHNGPTPATSG